MPGQYSAADLAEQPAAPPVSGKGRYSLDDVAPEHRKSFLDALGEGPLSMERDTIPARPPAHGILDHLSDPPLPAPSLSDVGKTLWPGKGTEPNSPILNAVHSIPLVGPGLAAAGKEFTENPSAFAGHAIAALATPTGAPGETTVNWRSPIKTVSKALPDIPPSASKYVPDLIEKPYNYANAATKLRLQKPARLMPMIDRGAPAWAGTDLQPVPPPPGEIQSIPGDLPSGRTVGPAPAAPPPPPRANPAWQNAQYPPPQAQSAAPLPSPAALPSGRTPGPARVLRAEAPPGTDTPDFSTKPPEEPPAAAPAPKTRVPRSGLKPPGRGVSTTITDPQTLLPDKIVTDDGVRQWASSNGLSEQDAADFMRANGYAVMGRSELNQMAHGAASDLGMDHGALSDVARIRYGVDSMTKLKPDQMLDLYQNLVGQKGVKGAIRGKNAAPVQAPPMAHGGIVRPRFKMKGARPQLPSKVIQAPHTPAIPAGLDPVPDIDAPVAMAKGGVIGAGQERVRGSIDLPLAPEGLRDADELGKRFAEKGGIDQIVSGNLTRTRQTTEALQRHNPKAKVTVTGALQPWHLGELEGQPRDKVTPIIKDYVHRNPNAPLPGKAPGSTAPGESFKGAKNRVLPVIQQAMRQYLQNPNQTIVLVMHRSGISVAHGWAALGFPADLSVDPHHVTKEREHEPAYRLAPGKAGKFELKPFDASGPGRKRPGVFLVAHPETAWNRPE